MITLKQKRNIHCAALILFFLCLSYGAGPGYALSIDPSRAEVTVKPGKRVYKEYTITNEGNAPIEVDVFADKWEMMKKKDATSWVKVRPGKFIIQPKGSKKVKCIVDTPEDVKGEYTTSLVFRSSEVIKVSESIGAKTQIRLAMYVIIDGTEDIRGKLLNFEVANANPLKVNVGVKNLGNIHIRPKGSLEITKIEKTNDGFERNRIDVIALNSTDGPVFPGQDSNIGPQGKNKKLDPGNYEAKVEVKFGPDLVMEDEIKFVVADDGSVDML